MCPNGHKVEWGKCPAQVKGFFGGQKECGSRLFEQIYSDGSTLTVSFDDREWNAVQCVKCKEVYTEKPCPECGAKIPVSSFRKKGFFSKLG
jgi:hypothetical protein